MGQLIEAQVKQFLQNATNGTAELSEDLIEEFGELCKEGLRKQFSPYDTTFRYRLSQVGKPVCQQQWDKLGYQGEQESYNLVMKFLMGDLLESVAIVVLKGAGVQVADEQKEVTLKVNDTTIKGTQDLAISNKVWDIKSCSPYAFDHKFNDSFQAVVDNDDFGYVPQLYAYGEAEGNKVGGWIVIQKVTGEWAFCNAPRVDNSYRKQALKTISVNHKILEGTTSDKDVQRQFQPVEETYYKKPTGALELHRTCTYCKHKGVCYPMAELREPPHSKAKNPKKKWYM